MYDFYDKCDLSITANDAMQNFASIATAADALRALENRALRRAREHPAQAVGSGSARRESACARPLRPPE
jgi:hypothetical protein